MKCKYCGKEIEEDENFYIYESEIYCNKCCEEETRTYHTIGGDPETLTEDEVEEFMDKEEAISDLQMQLESTKITIEELKVSDKPYAKHYIEVEEKRKARIEKILKVLKDDKED